MAMKKTRVRKHVIADMSLHHLAYIIVSCTFTIERTQSDYGYDLAMFTFDTIGQYENGNVFIQLKATDRLKIDQTTHDIKFRITKRDILSWESEPFPVYLVVFDAVGEKAYSIYLQQYFAKSGISSATMKGASIEVRIPDREVDVKTIQGWRTDKNAVLKQMGEVAHVQSSDL